MEISKLNLAQLIKEKATMEEERGMEEEKDIFLFF